MKVKDLMTKDVACVDPNATIAEAAKLMNQYDVGSIPVCKGETVVGIVTDRDIVLRNIALGADPLQTRVEEIMTKEVYTTSPNTDIDDASEVMFSHQVRRLPVVEQDRLIGILALGDIAVQEEYDFEAAKALSEISEPTDQSFQNAQFKQNQGSDENQALNSNQGFNPNQAFKQNKTSNENQAFKQNKASNSNKSSKQNK